MPLESHYDQAFADTLAASDFRRWLLTRSRFAPFADTARLLIEEQEQARKARQWWKHWWGYLPDGTSSETDIFAVFESDDGQRFALHIENKPPHGKIDLRQAADYRRRAIHWARKEQYLSYGEFETILMAPATFIQANTACARQFDMTLSYEDLAAWIPFFAINGDRNAVTARCAPHAARRTRDDEGIVAEHDTSKALR